MQNYNARNGGAEHANFTQVCNYVLDNCSGEAQAIYAQMKRYAGKTGRVYAGYRTYRDKTGWGLAKIKKAIQELEEKELIINSGMQPQQTKGGVQNVQTWTVPDIWKKNQSFYAARCAQIKPPLSQGVPRIASRCAQNECQGVPRIDAYKDVLNKIYKKDDDNENENTRIRNEKLESVKAELIRRGVISQRGLQLVRDRKTLAAEEQAAKVAKLKN